MKIRILSLEDAEKYWQLRLRALKDHPDAFSASFEDSVKMPLEEVKKRLVKTENRFILGAFDDSERLIGMLGFFRETSIKLKHKGKVWGMYVIPEERGKGIGKALLNDIIHKARLIKDLEQIQLSVNTANVAARKLYISFGFQPFGLERKSLKINNQYFDEEHMAFFL
ncbi:GNAT family N-acetyltransferase [Thermoflavimicrobium dichotomicum]|uniref:Protein N-acetyltransferase, RimJ/RimL family n=1 Tax=Thermoflavimicrobium dichotomicum TaxID=46223 RepID=A0A1I3TEZ9_9BACL|nr:GNAT family N-acetyltransferase [Thermoflavimicrobium dichotomicum]SFJ69515.1 Protein N-acetyltransferase, RimJ/RimL family [Thermoflavimicrobium dichotomicum]